MWCKHEVSISSGLETVPGRDTKTDRQMDGLIDRRTDRITIANTCYSYASSCT